MSNDESCLTDSRAGRDPLACTTVLWVLQTLEEKGRIRHEKERRAFRYHPVMEQEEARGSALGHPMDKVHGSASMLLAQLVGEHDLPSKEMRRMRDLRDRRLAEEES